MSVERTRTCMADLKIVSSGLDWLTTTATDKMTARLLLREAEKIQREEAARGFFVKPWRQSGYAGFHCGRIQHGERYDSAIVRLTSDLADAEWFRVYQISEHATRLDVQITFRPSIGVNPYIHRVKRQLNRHFRNFKRRPLLRTITASDGGLTLYLGARQSAVFFRCYNKEVESGEADYEGCCRMELELKDCAVQPAMEFLFRELPSSKFACGLIGSFAKERGISGLMFAENPPSLYEGQSAATDVMKACKWLKTQVQPTVLNLIQHGELESVLTNLGLSEFVMPLSRRN